MRPDGRAHVSVLAASPGSDSTMGGVGAPETCMEATANDEVPSDPSRMVGSAERD